MGLGGHRAHGVGGGRTWCRASALQPRMLRSVTCTTATAGAPEAAGGREGRRVGVSGVNAGPSDGCPKPPTRVARGDRA